MKKGFYLSLAGLIFLLGFTSPQRSGDDCDKKALINSCKKKLTPYKYDTQKFTKINYTQKEQLLEVEVPVFIGEKYRLIFNTSSLPKGIKINVYTKNKETKNREPILSIKEEKAEEQEFVFDAPRARKMFVNYTVPADTINQNLSGCVLFMLGYK